MTCVTDSSTELTALQEQKKAARNAYKEQTRTLKDQIKFLKQDSRRTRKIAKLESRLDALKGSTTTE